APSGPVKPAANPTNSPPAGSSSPKAEVQRSVPTSRANSTTTASRTSNPNSRAQSLATPAVPQQSPAPALRPGGISLTRAAVDGMRLNISLDGAQYKDGTLVLTGRHDDHQTLDAALFLTALRLACEPNDPYFSLDPDDGGEWLREAFEA